MQNIVSAFEVANRLADITRRDLRDAHYPEVKANFAFAEKWLREGSAYEKLAISNVFLYSIATTIDCLGRQRARIMSMFLPLLRREYIAQTSALSV